MGSPAFVDSHIHLWDRTQPGLAWDWLTPGMAHPNLGDISPLQEREYRIEDFKTDIEGCNVTKAVHVQAAIGSEDPVRETEWLQSVANDHGMPNAIVAYSNLKSPDVETELERHCTFVNVRGIRDFSEGDYLVDPSFHRGFALLEKLGLVCDLDVTWETMGKARNLAEQFTNTRIVCDHAGFPQGRDEDYFHNWLGGMKTLAGADNVVCKISGLGMGDHMVGRKWTIDSIRPWVLGCIEAFGVDRCFFGTNWPVDRLFSDYRFLVDAYVEIVKAFSNDEIEALFSRNAEEIYRI